ncbi:hypothetical protein CQJ94_23170 [Glycomyces fuscus]|nr:hypothetical protein CQJ94_23170 [Glycomyces fuscus]
MLLTLLSVMSSPTMPRTSPWEFPSSPVPAATIRMSNWSRASTNLSDPAAVLKYHLSSTSLMVPPYVLMALLTLWESLYVLVFRSGLIFSNSFLKSGILSWIWVRRYARSLRRYWYADAAEPVMGPSGVSISFHSLFRLPPPSPPM